MTLFIAIFFYTILLSFLTLGLWITFIKPDFLGGKCSLIVGVMILKSKDLFCTTSVTFDDIAQVVLSLLYTSKVDQCHNLVGNNIIHFMNKSKAITFQKTWKSSSTAFVGCFHIGLDYLDLEKCTYSIIDIQISFKYST